MWWFLCHSIFFVVLVINWKDSESSSGKISWMTYAFFKFTFKWIGFINNRLGDWSKKSHERLISSKNMNSNCCYLTFFYHWFESFYPKIQSKKLYWITVLSLIWFEWWYIRHIIRFYIKYFSNRFNNVSSVVVIMSNNQKT